MNALYSRTPGVEARRVGAGLFLAHPERSELYRLNVTMAAVWNALEEPLTGTALLALFRQAFPRTGARKMRSEVQIMLNDLVESDLIERRAVKTPRAKAKRRGPPRKATKKTR